MDAQSDKTFGTVKPQIRGDLLKRSFISAVFFRGILWLYQFIGSERLRSLLRRLSAAGEGGGALSPTVREIYRRFHGVEIGRYTAGPCRIKPVYLHKGTVFGRYVSVAPTLRTFTRHHPRNLRSTHGLFYNPALGKISGAPLKFNKLEIGHGACIGHDVIILHPAERVGEGAIIAPGSVVYSNIPPYAIVSGNPAVVTGYRFSKEIIAELLASCWWEKSPEELSEDQHPALTVGAPEFNSSVSP